MVFDGEPSIGMPPLGKWFLGNVVSGLQLWPMNPWWPWKCHQCHVDCIMS